MTRMWPQIRLFGLLALLAPLFMGLQYLVQESVPQIEVRFVTPDTETAAQPPAERVVERVVYVPIEKTEPAPLREPTSKLPQAVARAGGPVKLSGTDSPAAFEAAPPAQAAPAEAGAAEPADGEPGDRVASDPEPVHEPAVHIGVVAAVTPVAAPVVAAAPARAVAPQPRYVAPPVAVEAAPDEEEPAAEVEEAVAEEPVETAPVVAEAEPPAPTQQVAEITVVETMLDSQTTRVVSYKVPVQQPAPTQQAQSEPPAAPEAVAEEQPEGVMPEDAEEHTEADEAAEDPAATDEAAEEPVATDEAAEEPAVTDVAAAAVDEAGVEEEAVADWPPAGQDDKPMAIEDEPIAEAEAVETADEGMGEELASDAPAAGEVEEAEPIVVEVAEIERPNPAEPTVSSVQVTTVVVEQED